MRITQRVSRELKAASRRANEASREIKEAMMPMIASIKRRYSNGNKLRMAAGAVSIAAAIGLVAMAYVSERDRKEIEEHRRKWAQEEYFINLRQMNIHTNKLDVMKGMINRIQTDINDIKENTQTTNITLEQLIGPRKSASAFI